MKKIILSKIVAILLVINFSLLAQVPAFEGAEGGGAESKGGRGGKVIEVTNLNDAGAGSFRAACEASGPRIVIFKVAGIIKIDRIRIYNPYITIAAQTAPGAGITIRGNWIDIYAHDVVIRYLTVRAGVGVATSKCVFVREEAYNIILDHCSFSWASDENITMFADTKPMSNITVSWCISSEGISVAKAAQDKHSAGIIWGSNSNAAALNNLSVHHNFFSHNQFRMPYIKGANARCINNISYDWELWCMNVRGGVKVDIIGNIFKKGKSYKDEGWNNDRGVMWRFPGDGGIEGVLGNPSIYISGNRDFVYQNNPDQDNWNMMMSVDANFKQKGLVPLIYKREIPQKNLFEITIDNVNNLEANMLPLVGASQRINEDGNWIMSRDAIDSRLVKQYIEKTGGLIYNESEVGGFPIITSDNPYLDTDKDGMADKWETRYGFNPNNLLDGNEDADKDGYTNIEEFLNGTNPKENITDVTEVEVINQITIYPNPAQDLITISNAPIGTEIKLLDLQGRELITQKTASENTELNVQALPQGLYLLKVGNVIQKLTLE